jgi:endonuclease/exonuclease/phosphatase family metal-dependent hydrolase
MACLASATSPLREVTLALLSSFEDFATRASSLPPLSEFADSARARFFESRCLRRRAIVGLDRVWVHPRGRLRETRVEGSPAARIASDHLPLVATIDCSRAGSA